jgi:hypothetical protein
MGLIIFFKITADRGTPQTLDFSTGNKYFEQPGTFGTEMHVNREKGVAGIIFMFWEKP